jgi:hypothetical protein
MMMMMTALFADARVGPRSLFSMGTNQICRRTNRKYLHDLDRKPSHEAYKRKGSALYRLDDGTWIVAS